MLFICCCCCHLHVIAAFTVCYHLYPGNRVIPLILSSAVALAVPTLLLLFGRQVQRPESYAVPFFPFVPAISVVLNTFLLGSCAWLFLISICMICVFNNFKCVICSIICIMQSRQVQQPMNGAKGRYACNFVIAKPAWCHSCYKHTIPIVTLVTFRPYLLLHSGHTCFYVCYNHTGATVTLVALRHVTGILGRFHSMQYLPAACLSLV